VRSLESFSSIVQMARAGFGHGFVPRAVATALGVPAASMIELPGLTRPVRLVGRRLTLARPLLSTLTERLRAAAPPAPRTRRRRGSTP
jgi:DNA-binding transcriptional LysR family regulator